MGTPQPKIASVARSQALDSTTPHAVTGSTPNSPRPVTEEDIRLCAYRKWENAGKPTGEGLPFWLEAEQELTQRREDG